MRALAFSASALKDLDAITERIAEERGVAAALRILEEIESTAQLLCLSPSLGRAVPEADFRELVVGNYVLPYLASDSTITILRVWHGRQRWWG